MLNQVYEGLTGWSARLVPVPALAQDWTISDDHTDFRFTLRPDLIFHDGTQLTAEKVVARLRQVVRHDAEEPGVAHEVLQALSGIEPWLAGDSSGLPGLTAPGDGIIRIRFTRPVPDLLQILAMDAFLITDGTGNGAGPFRLASVTDSLVVMTAFEDYYAGRAALDSILVFQDPDWDGESDVAAFDAGRVDVIEVPAWEWDRFKGRQDVVLQRCQQMTLEFIGFDTDSPEVSDPDVRLRLARNVDWSGVTGGSPLFIRATSLIPPGLPGYRERPDLFLSDPGASRERQKEGETITYTVSGDPDYVYEEEESLVARWQTSGFRVQLEVIPWVEFERRVEDRDLEMFGMAWTADYPSSAHFLYSQYHSGGWGNYFHYSDARVDSLLDVALWSTDPTERMRLCSIAESKILQDLPIIPTRFPISVWAIREDLRGVEMGVFGMAVLKAEKVWWAR